MAELNKEIARKLTELNNRKFQKLDTTRREIFEKIDKPALKSLPPKKYEYAEWKKARVNIDYHIELDRHYYSVPYQLRKEQVDVRYTGSSVEILFKNKRVASYYRSYKQGGFTSCINRFDGERPESNCHKEKVAKGMTFTPERGWENN